MRGRSLAGVAAVLGGLLGLVGCTGHLGPLTRDRSVSPPSWIDGPAPGQPNIVFVLTDDLSTNLLKYMPHAQALQARGTSFDRDYVVDSLCCPSRAAIFTGEYPHNDGVYTNGPFDGGYSEFQARNDARATFAVALEKAGYRTAFMGKYLNGYHPYDPVAAGWNQWDVTGDGYPEYDYNLNENGVRHPFGHAPRDYLTDVLSNQARSFIDVAARAHEPFALEIATFAPHRADGPPVPAPRDLDTFPHLTVPRTAAFDRLPSDPPAWLRFRPPLTRQKIDSLNLEFERRVESVQAVDRMIGALEATLRKDNVARETYFVFSSDNGYHMGEYRLGSGKQTAFETDIHVPLVVTGPGVPAGRRVDAMTSSIDLAPTFEQIAGARTPPTVDGVSMLGLWHGAAPPARWQQAVLIEHHGPPTSLADPDYQPRSSGIPPSYEAIRTVNALYVRYDNGGQEYYNTTRDPDELHNIVATLPRATLHRMRAMLAALERCRGRLQCQAAARPAAFTKASG